MIIISIVLSIMVFNMVYPAVVRSGDSLVNMRTRIDDRLKSQVSIVHVTGEYGANGNWSDTNGDGRFNAFVWVKNIGSTRISAVERMDLFFGPQGNFTHIPYVDQAGGSYPYWDWAVENDSLWEPTATGRITIHYSSSPARGRYFVKVVIPSGVADEMYFGL
jgi:hypothetical protein